MVFRFVENNRNQAQWWLPWSSHWFLQIENLTYLLVIFAAFVVCMPAVLFAIIRNRFNLVALSLQLQFIFVTGLWIVWQRIGQTALQPDYFAHPIYPVMFFGLAGLAATSLPTKKSRTRNDLISWNSCRSGRDVLICRSGRHHTVLLGRATRRNGSSDRSVDFCRPLCRERWRSGNAGGSRDRVHASNALGTAVSKNTDVYTWHKPYPDGPVAWTELVGSGH
jgi:hypothetical protein